MIPCFLVCFVILFYNTFLICVRTSSVEILGDLDQVWIFPGSIHICTSQSTTNPATGHHFEYHHQLAVHFSFLKTLLTHGMVSLGLEIFSWFLFFSTLSSTKDKYTSFSCCLLFFWSFLGLHPQHMEVPRLGVESELQLLAYTTAMATWDPSRVCNPHHSSQWCQIPNLLSEARDQIPILMDNRFVPAEPRQALLISLFLKPLALPCIFHAPRNY